MVLHPACWVSMVHGRRARAYGAHLPVRVDLDLASWSRWPVEKDALGRTRAPRKGSTNYTFKQQLRAAQTP